MPGARPPAGPPAPPEAPATPPLTGTRAWLDQVTGAEVATRALTPADAAAHADDLARSDGTAGRRSRPRRRLPPWWPVAMVFYGFPLWWVLGLHSFMWQVAAIPLAGRLVSHRRDIRVPKGFGIWMLFLVWVALSASQLERGSQLGPFLYRFSLYLSATIFMLYAANSSRDDLPVARVWSMCTALFVTVVAGGWLGVLVPNGQFTTPVERLLPQRLATDTFIKPLVHADFAQVQEFLGYPLGRPQAPFAYTNHWGSMFALLVPIVALGWARTRRSTNPLPLQMLLCASLVPAIVSLNRGMALSLLVALIYASTRGGRTSANARRVLGSLLVVFAVLMIFTPLGRLVQDRSETSHSNRGRGLLYEQAVDYAAQRPYLGYGAPQQVQGDLILPPVGTQGQFWLVLVSQGWVGLALFVAFLVQMVRTTRRFPEQVSLVHLLVIIVLVQMFVYELLSSPFQVLFLCIGLGVREAALDARSAEAAADRSAPVTRPIPSSGRSLPG